MLHVKRGELAYGGNLEFFIYSVHFFQASRMTPYLLKLVDATRCCKWNIAGTSDSFIFYCMVFFSYLLYWHEYNLTFELSPTPKFWANFKIGYTYKSPLHRMSDCTDGCLGLFVNLEQRKCQNLEQRKCQPSANIKELEDNKNCFFR